MYSREHFWIFDSLVHISLQNFAKGCRVSRESELLVQAQLLQNAEYKEFEKDQYEESYGVRAIWYFITTVLSNQKSLITFDDNKSKPLETAIVHLDEALKCKFGRNRKEIKSFKKDLEKLKSETIIHAIGAVLNNKAEAKKLYNFYQEFLTKFQQDSIKCVLLSLQDFDKTFGSLSGFVKQIEIVVQKMLKIIHDSFIVKIAKNCCERLDVKSVEYGRMKENLESDSDTQEYEIDSNSSYGQKPTVENERTPPKKTYSSHNSKLHNEIPKDSSFGPKPPVPIESKQIRPKETHTSPDRKSHNEIPDDSSVNITPIKNNVTVFEPSTPQRTESFHKNVTSTPNVKAANKSYTFKKPPIKINFPVLSTAVKKPATQSHTSSMMSYASRHKRPFTSLQDAYIIMGKQKFATDARCWRKMIDFFPFPEYRTGVHLKDRWRTMLKNGDVAIENNELKLSEQYTTIIKHLAPKFATNGHFKTLKAELMSNTPNKTRNDCRVNSAKLDLSSIDELSDIESDEPNKGSGFSNVEKWIKTSKKETDTSKKIPPLLPEKPKPIYRLQNTESPKRENSSKYQLIKNASGKYIRQKSTDRNKDSQISSTPKKTTPQNRPDTSVIKRKELATTSSKGVLKQGSPQKEQSVKQNALFDSTRPQKMVLKDNPVKEISAEKNIAQIDESPKTEALSDGKKVEQESNISPTKACDATSLAESAPSKTCNSSNKNIDSEKSQKSSHTSTFLDPEFAKNSPEQSQAIPPENHSSEEISLEKPKSNIESEKNHIDDGEESVGELVIDESFINVEKKDDIIEKSFVVVDDECSQNPLTNPLQLHISLSSSETEDSTNEKNMDLEDDLEITLIANQNDNGSNTDSNFKKSPDKISGRRPLVTTAESKLGNEELLSRSPSKSIQSTRSGALSPTSSEYFTAHEDGSSTTSGESSQEKESTGEEDKTIINNETVIQVPKAPNTSGVNPSNDESQYQGTLDLLDKLDADSQSPIKAEPSSNCVPGMFDSSFNSVADDRPDTESLLDKIANLPGEIFSSETDKSQIEYIATRTRNAIKKEQNADILLQPPPNEMEVRDLDKSICDKTPILKLNKVKVEPGVYSTDLCMFIEMSGDDVIDLTHCTNENENSNSEPINLTISHNLHEESAKQNDANKPRNNNHKTIKSEKVLSEINSNGISTSQVCEKTQQNGEGDASNGNSTDIGGNLQSIGNIKCVKKFNSVKVKLPSRKRKIVLQDNGVPVKLSKEDKELFFGNNTTLNKDKTVFSTIGKPKQGRRKVYSQDEDDNLLEGVKMFGEGNWKLILDKFKFENRTAVNLKDRYRILKEK